MRTELAACLLVLACGAMEPPEAPVGPDCQLLSDLASRAAPCDAALGSLGTELLRHPDEADCRRAVRGLLAPVPPAPLVRSLHEAPAIGSDLPLSSAEREALIALPLPATLTLAPDLPSGPGVPETRATLGEEVLRPDSRGYLRGRVAPGSHTIEIRHAGNETVSCVTVDACEALTLTLHGPRPASHPRVTAGPCQTPPAGVERVATGATPAAPGP